MAAPTVYTWRDDGAPVFKYNDITSLHAVFSACLVDGYGSKQPPGSGNNKWAITLGGASLDILLITQGGSSSIKATMAIDRISNQYGRGYASIYQGNTIDESNAWMQSRTKYIPLGYARSTDTAIPWIIIATERSMYCTFGYNSDTTNTHLIPPAFDNHGGAGTYSFHWFFGDYTPVNPNQKHNQVAVLKYTNSQFSLSEFHTAFSLRNSTYLSKYMAGSSTDQFNPMYCDFIATTPINYGESYHYGGANTNKHHPHFPNKVNGGLYLEPARLAGDRTIVGEMPGLLFPMHHGAVRNASQNGYLSIDGEGAFLGETLLGFRSGYGTGYFIRLGDWGVE